MARPSEFTPECADKICTLLAGGKSLRAICRPATMPDRETVRRWRRENEEFRGQYARARVDQADSLAEEIVAIADTEKDPAKARVRIDARKWYASKLNPKTYGDKLELGGGLDLRLPRADPLSEDEWAEGFAPK